LGGIDRRYRGRRVPFSCFALPDSFSMVPRTSCPICMLCPPGLVFGGNEGVGSSFHVLRSRASFGALSRASSPVFMFCAPRLIFDGAEGAVSRFMFCAPELVFGGNEGAGSRLHFLCSRAHFRRSRGHQVQFSCFVLPTSFGAVPRASGHDFMFYVPGLVFGGIDSVGSHFHVLLSRTHFGRYRGRRVQFPCFALPESFSAVPSSPGLVFIFCAPRLIFDGSKDVGSRLHILRSRTRFWRNRGRRV
jgi:hypothetical protein